MPWPTILNDSSLPTNKGLAWPPLLEGKLIKRRNRFVAEILLPDLGPVLAHCPNSGSMLGCNEPGRPAHVSVSLNPKRKCPYTWELIEMPGSLVGVNTLTPNRLIGHSIKNGVIQELSEYDAVQPEVRCSDKSRLDFLLSGHERRDCYVEVKNCTLVENKIGYFPDAITTRGLKHLNELDLLVKQGPRAALFILIQRMDAELFSPADHIHPEYGQKLRSVVQNGVELLCYDVSITIKGISIRKRIPYLF